MQTLPVSGYLANRIDIGREVTVSAIIEQETHMVIKQIHSFNSLDGSSQSRESAVDCLDHYLVANHQCWTRSHVSESQK